MRSGAGRRSVSRRSRRVASRRVRDLVGVAHISETAVEPAAELVWVEFLMRATPAGNHHTRSGYPR
jgi:hypothetical protein